MEKMGIFYRMVIFYIRMFKMMNLGIIKDENGDIIMHRTILKIVMNPILRKFGCSIVSCFDDNNNLLGYKIKKYPENCRVIKD